MVALAKWIKWLFVSAFALIAALAQVPPEEAISNLGGWAERVGIENWPAWITDGRATAVGITGAILLAAGPWAWGRWRRRGQAGGHADPVVVLTPDKSLGPESTVAVENRGPDGRFAATGQVVQVKGDPNPARLASFKVCWIETNTGIMQIERGQTRHLKLGETSSWDAVEHGRQYELRLLRMETGGCATWDRFRWFRGQEPPRITVRLVVTRLESGQAEEPATRVVEIRPDTFGGVRTVVLLSRPASGLSDTEKLMLKILTQEGQGSLNEYALAVRMKVRTESVRMAGEALCDRELVHRIRVENTDDLLWLGSTKGARYAEEIRLHDD